MKLLSISNSLHDFNISYFDGVNVHYLKTERIEQIKHHGDRSYFGDMKQISNYIKTHFNISIDDVDAVCLDSLYMDSSNAEYINDLQNKAFHKYNDKFYFINHHYMHALSSYILQDREFTFDIIIDGQGGKYAWNIFKNNIQIDCGIYEETGSIGHGMVFLAKQIGLTGHHLDLAGKVMGLQSYGNVDHTFKETLHHYNMKNVGSKIQKEYRTGIRPSVYGMFDLKNIDNKLDGLKTIHDRCGEIILDLFDKYVKEDDSISYSGGIAQNVIWNTLLKKKYKNLTILPHVNDEGLSLGGLEFLRRQFNLPKFDFTMFPFMQTDEAPREEASDSTIEYAAKRLSEGKIIAWYQGHGEIGPRALGNRSILMDPRIKNGKDIINKIKNREYFRPFGASILSEYAKEYFDMDYENPYMLYVGTTQKNNLDSITHVDGTSRVQTVSKPGHFRSLLEKFNEITGCPVLLNTSLNISGKPIASHISDAIYEYENTNIDVLVVGDTIYDKSKI